MQCYLSSCTEAIANRLKSVLGDVISHNQNAFISNRLITDNVRVGYKCLHKLQSCKSYKNGLVTMKLDIVEAYDWVEWGFSQQVMYGLGFLSSGLC